MESVDFYNSDFLSSGGGGKRRLMGSRLTSCAGNRNIMICFAGVKSQNVLLMNLSTRDALALAESLGNMAARQEYEQSKEVPF
jgi:hypothetical protein